MIIRKSFQYRLHPTKKQEASLSKCLNECRWLYNELLEERIVAYEELEMTLSKYDQMMFLPFFKEERTSLADIHSQVLQNVVDRLDKAFQAFFRRCKKGEKPGFPRFRGIHRYSSFCYPQTGFSLIGNELKLSKIGNIRVKLHRPIGGNIKTCTIRRTPSGFWEVSFSCEVNVEPSAQKKETIALDMGLELFAVLSDGNTIPNPRFFKQGQKRLAKAQRKLSKFEKGTKERGKAGKVVTKIHEKIRNQRKNFCHKESKKLVENYQTIYMEDLSIKKMIQESFFAKSIADASWNQFCQFLTYKAAEAGRTLELVNPAYTTQICNQCGYLKAKDLTEREHHCLQCGYRASRDFNAARNILALGLNGLGVIPRSPRL
jgi:putative transposase